MSAERDRLARLAAAISDAAPVDWETEVEVARASGGLELIHSLRLIADVAEANRRLHQAASPIDLGPEATKTVQIEGDAEPAFRIPTENETPFPQAERLGSGIPPEDTEGAGRGTSQAAHRALESLIGRKLSHYRVIEKVGEGGMGVVWKAEDTVLGRIVAIKVLPPHSARDEKRRKMFLNEARLASTLSEAHIAQVYEFGREGDLDFIVMEYVEGKPLVLLPEIRLSFDG